MANITTYLRTRLLQQSIGKAPSTSWNSLTYAGLFVTAPSESGASSGVEVQGTGYERKPIANTAWTSPNSLGQISNANDITWTAGGVWAGTSGASTAMPIVSVGLFDASSSGNLLWFGPLSASVTMVNTDTFTISAGSLILTLA
jgi:hypothetical protein